MADRPYRSARRALPLPAELLAQAVSIRQSLLITCAILVFIIFRPFVGQYPVSDFDTKRFQDTTRLSILCYAVILLSVADIKHRANAITTNMQGTVIFKLICWGIFV